MPRNSSGTMTLPAPGVPFQSGTTVGSAQMNATLTDLATEISDSASRSGKGGFTAPVRVPDGTAAAPAVAFTAEINSGAYRAGASDVRLAVGGVDALKLVSGGVAGPLVLAAGSTAIQVTLTNGFLLLQGNQSAGATPPDVATDSSVARTAGNLFGVRNNGANKLFVDYQGLLQLVTPAAAIQPASILTSLTVGANWAIVGNLAFWKDAGGTVHLQGGATPGTGAAGTIFTMPTGFRPRSDSTPRFVVSVGAGSTTNTVVIDPISGACSALGAVTTGATIAFDSITFLAGQ